MAFESTAWVLQSSPPALGFLTGILESIATGVLQGGIYALVSLGLTLIFGVMGIINFAQADFLTWGMYLTVVIVAALGLSPLLIFFLLIPLAILVGVVIERGLIQHVYDASEDAQLIVAFGLFLILQSGALAVFGPNSTGITSPYAEQVFRLGPILLNQAKTIAFVFAMGMTGALFVFLKYTEFGRAIRATSNNRDAAEYSGVNTERVFMVAFGIGIALTGSAGALLVMYYPVTPTLGMEYIIMMFVVVIFGGLGSVKGAFVAGILIGVIEQLAITVLPLELKPAIAFVLFLLVVVVRPQGLYGTSVRSV